MLSRFTKHTQEASYDVTSQETCRHTAKPSYCSSKSGKQFFRSINTQLFSNMVNSDVSHLFTDRCI